MCGAACGGLHGASINKQLIRSIPFRTQVKLETEDEDLENDITCTELPEFTTVQNANDVDTATLCSIDNKKSTDPLTMLESVKRELDADGARVICAQEEEYKADFDEDE